MQKHFDKLSTNKKGFTIIELIVVIAIIAVLAAIVLVNVTQYINKSKNAAIKANLSGLITSGTIYLTENSGSSGDSWINSSEVTNMYDVVWGLNVGFDYHGDTESDSWCVCAPLHPNAGDCDGNAYCFFCIDSAGNKLAAGSDENSSMCSNMCDDGTVSPTHPFVCSL